MSRIAALVASLLMVAGCATRPSQDIAAALFLDPAFAPPSQRIDADEVFALSLEMKRYVDGPLADQVRAKGGQKGLIDALYTNGGLKLAYDSVRTGNAEQTFAARSGNCLSLVIMTAAFAKAIGVSVQYQSVAVEETWSRNGGIYFSLGHVNLTLGRGMTSIRYGQVETSRLTTIDFLPPGDIRGQITEEIGEERIVAMFLNNRAGESLADGRIDDAYWWARAAILKDPGFLSSYNTLGVVYRRHGDLREAEQLFASVLRLQPSNRQAMSNLALVLKDEGRAAEAARISSRLEALEPNPPFYFFERGLAALRDRDYATARDLFAREVDRTAGYHEFHFWLAIAYVNLGETAKARQHLALAIEHSTARKDTDLYLAKLARLKGPAVH
jgi:tetratricopeptide (TPR) repeat protein